MRPEAVAADAPRVVNHHVQRPRSHHLGIEKLERTRACVSRIHERLPSGLVQRLVEPDESVASHIDLAADLKHIRRVVRQCLRYRPYRPHVLRHVVAHLAVASGRGPDQPPVFVKQRHRDAVYLRLDDIPPLRAARHLAPQKGVELHQIALLVALVERFHRRLVTHLDESVYRRAAHADRRGVRILILRKLLLEGDQLLIHPVVVGVGDHRPRFDVVEPVVAVYLRYEPLNPAFCFGGLHSSCP